MALEPEELWAEPWVAEQRGKTAASWDVSAPPSDEEMATAWQMPSCSTVRDHALEYSNGRAVWYCWKKGLAAIARTDTVLRGDCTDRLRNRW